MSDFSILNPIQTFEPSPNMGNFSRDPSTQGMLLLTVRDGDDSGIRPKRSRVMTGTLWLNPISFFCGGVPEETKAEKFKTRTSSLLVQLNLGPLRRERVDFPEPQGL